MNINTASANTYSPSQQALKVLRNAYSLLALSMLPTIVGAYVGVRYAFDMVTLLSANPIMGMVGYFLVVFGLLFAIHKTANSAVAIPLLFTFTFVLGAALGPLLQVALMIADGPALIAYAAGTTALIFFGLASYITATGKDCSKFGKFLFIGLILAIVASIANIFFAIPALSLAVSAVLVLLMSMYIMFDISRVIHGGETNYILVALSLYLNVYILFTHLLRIMMILSGGRE